MDKLGLFTFMLTGLYLFSAIWDAFKEDYREIRRFVFFALLVVAVKFAFKVAALAIAL